MMTAIMKKHLKKNKKGFTLIEVVVVLVILAILAAIAVPALTGYIQDAKERTAFTEARTVLVGLQHMASTDAVDNAAATKMGYFSEKPSANKSGMTLSTDGIDKLNSLTGLAKDQISTTKLTGISIDKNSKVTEFVYSGSGESVTYSGGEFKLTTTP